MRWIYKRTQTGAVQVWAQELGTGENAGSYRSHSGQQNGVITVGAWVVCQPTSVGRSNERNAEQQAVFEVAANYDKKLGLDYHENIANIDKPIIFQPMLAHKYADLAEKGLPACETGAFFSQPKLDGIRCIATSVGLFSRNGKRIVACPHVLEALAPLFEKNTDLIFDGELYNHELKDDFNTLVSAIKKQKPDAASIERAAAVVQYHIYDLPSSMDKGFANRFSELQALLQSIDAAAVLIPVETHEVLSWAHLDELYGEYLIAGYEGQMLRRDMPYEQKRSKTLLKRKEFQDVEFIVTDITEGVGAWAGCAKSVEFMMPDDRRMSNGRRPSAGVKGDMTYCAEILKNKDLYIGKPGTVRFQNYTPDGFPRFGVVYEFDRTM